MFSRKTSSRHTAGHSNTSQVASYHGNTSPDTTSNNSLYITLQYLRTVNGQNKYVRAPGDRFCPDINPSLPFFSKHWALYVTEKKAPAGYLVHATDTGRQALDLYKEVRSVNNPLRSKSMVVVLKIGSSVSLRALDTYASSVHLMDPRYLPRGEVQWTCRVWVKEVLYLLHDARLVSLPCGLSSLEEFCLAHADRHLPNLGKMPARIFERGDWADEKKLDSANDKYAASGRTGRYYGPSPMVIDSTHDRYYGSSPMQVDTTGRERYYGPSPMDTETHRR
ncbi:hypothetical protein FHL15_001162 [Xylaria flabelliformis]|uniref:Uncharacterized protein n=1 Tax=Xylaria flabelliformis TaxID=2512241 RepID=A0A553ICM3_9PEZI|nr:hypothetical protein FHL15_001162 [Xylaria flabelliformis]